MNLRSLILRLLPSRRISEGMAMRSLPGHGRAYVIDGRLFFTQGDGRVCPRCRIGNVTHAQKCKSCGSAMGS